ncbi:NADH-quinone oxidoreductase subunit K [Desulfurococcaceae archaeon MEX13E-LK6-19]|nr:NADH-quinone oxidoreductase subunit K [Desulfurococcaceae archaeon MEX13E-LK6-19]
MDSTLLFINILVVSLVTNLFIALYGLIFKPNMVKKIISLTIFSDTASITAVLIGYRIKVVPWPPVYLEPSNPNYVYELLEKSVDPVPQALVITAIVISLSFIIFLSVITLRLYEVFGSVNLHLALKREAIEHVESEYEVYEE